MPPPPPPPPLPQRPSSENVRIVRFDELDSTQRVAKEMLAAGEPSGTIVVAARQTAGRGRLGRSWQNAGAGLYASFVLRAPPGAPLPMAQAQRLTLSAAHMVRQALASLGVAASIKWPNDVVIAAEPPGPLGPYRKVAGVIVEVCSVAAPPQGGLEAAVLGIGVNVRAPEGASWGELALRAGALQDAGFTGDANGVLAAICARDPFGLPERARSDGAWGLVLDDARAFSATLGLRVNADGQSGIATALSDDGTLVLRADDGALHTVRAADLIVER